jgi:hypothetical protein
MLHWNKIRLKYLRISSYGIWASGIIAFAALIRIVLIAQGWPVTNSDESTMGLEAMHIAFRGEHPIFLYGQNYMGTLQAYLGAALFHLFPASLFPLRFGLVILFAAFLVSLYLLTSLLYTKKLALASLALLSFGSSEVFIREVKSLGGASETLLFGTIALLLATWLALSSGQDLSPRRRRWRFLAYGIWGFAVGIGLWSHMLVGPFVLMSGLMLVWFCWSEVRRWAGAWLLLGLLIGLLPLIIYNITAPLDQNSLVILWELHRAGGSQVPFDQNLIVKEILGTTLVSIPLATGANPLCPLTSMPLFGPGPPGIDTVGCSIAQGAWGLGYLALWTTALFLALRAFRKLWRRPLPKSWDLDERQAAIRHFARLMLLGGGGLTLFIYVISPAPAVVPWTSARYLVGLLVCTPAVLWPLWSKLGNRQSQGERKGVPSSEIGNDELKDTSVALAQGERKGVSLAEMGEGEPKDTSVATVSFQGKRLATAQGDYYLSPREGEGTPQSNHGGGPSYLARGIRGRRWWGILRSPWVVRGILTFIAAIYLLGTITTFLGVPSVQALNHQQDDLIANLSRIGATHIYSEYWTCDRIMFESREQIICSVLNDYLQPGFDRYLPYREIVTADARAAYVFPIGSPQVAAIFAEVAFSAQHYNHYEFDGYVVYQPE